MKPVISIIVPVYNAEKYLRESLDSAIAQSFKNWELIIINDGSADTSEEICNEYCAKDPRIKYVYQKNSGVSVARNTGIDVAEGEWIAFLDADDLLHADYLSVLYDGTKGNDCSIISFSSQQNKLGLGNGLLLKSASEMINDVVAQRYAPQIWCSLFKKEKIGSLRFTPGCIKNEDWEFCVRYFSDCDLPISTNSFVGYYYRIVETSAMHKPMDERSFTSIEASRRVGIELEKKGFIEDAEITLATGVLTYAYATASERNKRLYALLHERYDVKNSMKKMVKGPVFIKRFVALAYLLLGKDIFYWSISNISRVF